MKFKGKPQHPIDEICQKHDFCYYCNRDGIKCNEHIRWYTWDIDKSGQVVKENR